jgi:hypothetical protein
MQETDHNFSNSISLGYKQAMEVPKQRTYAGMAYDSTCSIYFASGRHFSN